MRRPAPPPVLVLLPLLFACASSTQKVVEPATPPADVPAAPAAPAVSTQAPEPEPAAPMVTGVLPMSCASGDGGVCLPEPAFAKRLCEGSYPDVALVLLAKDAPFTRMYMTGDVDAWNADGGKSARTRLRFDEEVLALRKRAAPTGGIVVGSGGGFLVMRWDGNCYTLEDSELTARRPPAVKHAPIAWRYLGERTREALLQSAKVAAAYQRRGKECKGAVSGEVTKACEQADVALSASIVSEVRAGLSVPTPARLP